MSAKRINIDLAKLATEKNIIIQSFSNCWIKTLDGEIIHRKDAKDSPSHNRGTVMYQQPTQTELQAELRKYGIEVFVYPKLIKNKRIYMFRILKFNFNFSEYIGNDFDLADFDSYELALETGLITALNSQEKFTELWEQKKSDN